MTRIERRNMLRLRLDEVKRSYQLNLKDLDIQKERRLHTEEVKLMKALGIYITNPCPLHSAKACYECKGHYRWVNNEWIECHPNSKGARFCELKRRV